MDTTTEIQGSALENKRHHGGPGEEDPVIRARDLSKVYRYGITAVDGLDLSVGRGEVFGLLGPNTLDRKLSVRENLYYHGRYFVWPRPRLARRTDRGGAHMNLWLVVAAMSGFILALGRSGSGVFVAV